MGKPVQASEAQLNAWVSSLASNGDVLLLAKPTSRASTRDSGSSVTTTRQAKKRQRGDKFKRDVIAERPSTGANNNNKKRGRTDRATEDGEDYRGAAGGGASKYASHNDDELDADEPPAAAIKSDEEDNAENCYSEELAAMSRLIKNVLNKVEPVQQKHYAKKPYSPGKLPAASVSKRKLNLQPRKCDYGGIGLARPSLYIALDESGWRRKLNQNFLEHIPGFFGKQRSKAMKKQLNGDMLWKQRLAMKQAKDEQGPTATNKWHP
jgi:hypothetical protein